MIGLECIYHVWETFYPMVEVQASISFYKCGSGRQAKIYLPREYNLGRRITLIYKGVKYLVSVSPSHSNGGGWKIYVPADIRKVYEHYDSKPKRVLLEVIDGENLEILYIGWICRVCGELTMEEDELCWNHRLQGIRICKRCGRKVGAGSSLCKSCLDKFVKACLGFDQPLA